jgi:hypothetical protein
MSIASTQGLLEQGLNVRVLWMVDIYGMLRDQAILLVPHSVPAFMPMLQGALTGQYTEVILLATVLQYIVHLMEDTLGPSILSQLR